MRTNDVPACRPAPTCGPHAPCPCRALGLRPRHRPGGRALQAAGRVALDALIALGQVHAPMLAVRRPRARTVAAG